MILSRNLKIDLIGSEDPLTKRTMFLRRIYRHNANICILGIGELIGVYDINTGYYSNTCKCSGDEVKVLAISVFDFKGRIHNEDSMIFLKKGKIVKDSMHENSIKGITKILKERVHSPYIKYFTEETVISPERKLTKTLIEKNKKPRENPKSHRDNIHSSNSYIVEKNYTLPTHTLDLQQLIINNGINFDNYRSKSKKNNSYSIEDNGFNSTRRIATSFHKSRNVSTKARPNSCSSDIEFKQINNTKSSHRFNNKMNIHVKLEEEDTYENSLAQKDNKNISLLINHIEPFGRIKKTTKPEIKEDNFVNIHAERKRRLCRNRMPSNWSFRASRSSPCRSHIK